MTLLTLQAHVRGFHGTTGFGRVVSQVLRGAVQLKQQQ